MKWILVIIIVVCNAGGDLLNSKGMKRHGEVHDFRPGGIARLVRKLVRNFHVVAGIVLMAIAFFALISLLSIADLSFAVPATASSYIIETVLAKYVLREHISGLRWLGAAFVAIGVSILDL
jgi:drug/metabolite transporter (DMT)-like permease